MAGTTRTLIFAEGVDVIGPSQNFLQTASFVVYAGTAAFLTAKGSAAALGDVFADSITNKILFYNGSFWQTVNDVKNNFTATTDPTPGDDSLDNYQIGSFWINTNDSTIFVATSVVPSTAVWLQVGRALVGKRQDYTSSVDGLQTAFNLSFVPIDKTILVLRNGVVVKDSEYSYVHPTLTMTEAPVLGQSLEIQYITNGQPSIAQTLLDQRVENRLITGGEITAKQLTLAATPYTNSEVIVDVRSGSPQVYGLDFVVTGAVLSWNGYALDGQIIAGSYLRVVYYTVV